MSGRDSEIIVWLNNKLGSTDDLWSGVSISSQLTKDRLLSIIHCFYSLQAHVKVKLLLAFLHVPKRNRDEWKEDLEDLYKMACEDADLWVSMVAEMLKTFPSSGNLNLDVKEDHRGYHEMIGELRKLVKIQQGKSMLPLESSYLSRNSLASVSSVPAAPAKHFALKRKPKSAALRVETLQKSTDAANNLKKNVSTFPVKMRSFAKKMDDDTPLRGLPNPTLSSSSVKFNSVLGRFGGPTSQRRDVNNQKEGGVKLIDFDSLPLTPKETRKRRKLEMEQQKAMKKEEASLAAAVSASNAAAAASSSAAAAATAMPEYAAGLLAAASFEDLKSPQSTNEAAASLAASSAVLPPAPAPSKPTSLLSPNIIISSANTLPTQIRFTVVPVSSTAASTQLTNQKQQFTPIIITQQNRMILTAPRLNPNNNSGQQQTILIQPSLSNLSSLSSSSSTGAVSTPTPIIIRAPNAAEASKVIAAAKMKLLQPPQMLQQPTQQAAASTENQPKKELYLTREQMLEAQEMFKTYPNITRPEKALILGFMAGARENPCPNQGPVLNIRLGETEESLHQPNGTFQPMVVETFLQLNYSTGEFKKLRKTREKEGDGE